MKSKKTLLEIKASKDIVIIPLIVIISISIWGYMMYSNYNEIMYTYNLVQFVIPIFSMFVIVNALSNFINNYGSEVFFTYPKATLKCSLFCVLKYGSIYICSTSLMISLLFFAIGNNPVVILISTAFQEIFYISISYVFMIIIGDGSWTIFVGFSYFIFEFLNRGEILPSINIYNFHNLDLLKLDKVINISVLSIVMITVGTFLVLKNKIGLLKK